MSDTIVNNESSQIIRILYDGFDSLLPIALRETSKGDAALLPERLRPKIDEMNEWIYAGVNNGVYRCGFATTDEAYREALAELYLSLERLNKVLGEPSHQPYLFGEHITEADIRLYPTVVRYDVGYSRWLTRHDEKPRLIRSDFPNLHDYLRRIYWNQSKEPAYGAFKETTDFDKMAALINRVPGMADRPPGAEPPILRP